MQRKVSRTWAAAFAFTLSALFVAQSLASDVIPASDSMSSPDLTSASPAPSPSASETPTASASAAPTASPSASNLTPGPTPSASSSKVPAYALEDQNIAIRIDNSVRVDPRAKSAFITPVYVSSDASLLACISSSSLRFDAGIQNAVDANVIDAIVGDFSSDLRITGTSAYVTQTLNALNGLKVFSNPASVVNKYLQLRFVAVSEPTTNEKLCNAGNPSNNRIINLNPFDLGLDMKKGDVRLAK